MPFVARADKYDFHYWENGRYVPLYFVAGELDGAHDRGECPRVGSLPSQAAEGGAAWVRCDGVEYQGRGHEPFHDEILNLFDWMAKRARAPRRRRSIAATLRPWDNFFWWLECDEFPPQFMIHPTEWTGRRPRPAQVAGKLQADNRLLVKSAAGRTTIWLRPGHGRLLQADPRDAQRRQGRDARGRRTTGPAGAAGGCADARRSATAVLGEARIALSTPNVHRRGAECAEGKRIF